VRTNYGTYCIVHLSRIREEQKYVACQIKKTRGSIITCIDVITLAHLTRDQSLVEIICPRFGVMNGFDREKNEITKCPPRTINEYRLNKLDVCTQSKGTYLY
jgi:hypothetical protein